MQNDIWVLICLLVFIIGLLVYDIVFYYHQNKIRTFFYQNESRLKNKVVFECILIFRRFLRSIYFSFFAILIFGDNSLIVGKIIWYLFFSYSVLRFYIIYSIWMEKREIKKLEEGPLPVQKNIYLYSWLGEADLQNSFLFELLQKDKMEKSDLYNLHKVKWYLKQRIGDSVEDYHLLKSLLEAQLKNNISELAKSIFAPLLVGCLTLLLRIFASSDRIKNYINEFFNITLTNGDFLTYITLIMDIFLIIMFVIYTVIFVLTVLNKDKKRIGTIIAVLDNIIYEKENK